MKNRRSNVKFYPLQASSVPTSILEVCLSLTRQSRGRGFAQMQIYLDYYI